MIYILDNIYYPWYNKDSKTERYKTRAQEKQYLDNRKQTGRRPLKLTASGTHAKTQATPLMEAGNTGTMKGSRGEGNSREQARTTEAQ